MKRVAWLLILAACGEPTPPDNKVRVTVQHVLIGFKGSMRDKPITRSKQEAHDLAYQILDRARNGEEFDALVKRYTDDSHPGIYTMVDDDMPSTGEQARSGMVKAFGDVSFKLKVGEFGIAEHDAKDSPYGWHVIKRLR